MAISLCSSHLTVVYPSSFVGSLLADRYVGYPSSTLINALLFVPRHLLPSFHSGAPNLEATLEVSKDGLGIDAGRRLTTTHS